MLTVPSLSSIEVDDKIWIRKDIYDSLYRQKNFWRRCADGLVEYVKFNFDEIPSETDQKEQAIYFINEHTKLTKLYND